MTISFDRLPSDIETTTIIPKGTYTAVVEKAEMTQPKTEGKAPYLRVTWLVKDGKKDLGRVFDIFTESDNQYSMYKLRTFIEALQINIGKTFELRDLTKVSVNKKCLIKVSIDNKTEPNKNQINIFDKPPYEALEKLDVVESEPDSNNADESY